MVSSSSEIAIKLAFGERYAPAATGLSILSLVFSVTYLNMILSLVAKRAGFDVIVHRDATRAVDVEPGDGDRAVEELRAAGVKVVD